MEQPKDYILTFEAFAKRGDGDAVPFSLRATFPVQENDGGFFSFVECRVLRETAFKIYGADTKQACELTVSFVRQRLRDTGTTLYDDNGVETDIPEIEISLDDEID